MCIIFLCLRMHFSYVGNCKPTNKCMKTEILKQRFNDDSECIFNFGTS